MVEMIVQMNSGSIDGQRCTNRMGPPITHYTETKSSTREEELVEEVIIVGFSE